MLGPNEHIAARRSLGHAVRAARTRRQLTQGELGQLCGWSQGKINKIETHKQSTAVDDVDTLIDELGIDETDATRMRAWARDTHETPGERPASPPWAREFLADERDAREVLTVHGERIPGVLHSEQYMLAQFQHAGVKDVMASMRQRRARQQLLDREHPPVYRAVLSESALRRAPGGRRSIVADQAEYLVSLTNKYPRLQVRILTFAADVAHMPPDFTILTPAPTRPTRDGDSPLREPYVYTEQAHHGERRRKDVDLTNYRQTWSTLYEAALSPQASSRFLRELANEHRTHF